MSATTMASRTAVLGIVIALAIGCSPAAEPGPTPSSSGAPSATPSTAVKTIVATGDSVGTTVARATAQAGAAQSAAAGLRSLSADIYRQLAARERTNLVFSPYSIAVALAMTRAGARGETAGQMDTVLHASQVGDLATAFNSLDQALAKRPGMYPYGYGPTGPRQVPLELATANRIWAQRDYAFLAPFLDTLSAYYGASVGIVDYVKAREAARTAINAWVSDRTKTRIPELIKQGVLNEMTRLVLTNAIYLKAQWARPFEKSLTSASTFHRLDGSTVQAPFMHAVASERYAAGPGYAAVTLPYVGGLSMVLVVPDAGSLDAFEAALDGQRLAAITADAKPRWVDLWLPTFRSRTATSLRDTLSALGMPIAFTGRADFSGISARETLVIQDVIHEAFISVDEDGTEAAAATAVGVGATAGPSDVVTLTADRPFLFLVQDDETGAILFMGRVLDPS